MSFFFPDHKKSKSADSQRDDPDDQNENKPYTPYVTTLVMNHPLFLMADRNRYDLMNHELSKSLLFKKICPSSIILFIIAALSYVTYLVLFTTIAMRTKHPQYYYNLTNFTFDSSLCQKVSEAVDKIANPPLKQGADRALRILMYILFAFHVVKIVWFIVIHILVKFRRKAMVFSFEIVSLGFSIYFTFDYDFQSKITMRCPTQWQIGACGLFLGYLGLFYYIEYIPAIGPYVGMIRVIAKRFLYFLPVFLVFIVAFGLTFYMLFQNFDEFQNVVIGFAKTSIVRKYSSLNIVLLNNLIFVQ